MLEPIENSQSREVIQPSKLVLNDSPLTHSWWREHVSELSIGGVIAGVVMVIAIAQLLHRTRRMSPCERAFARLSRRLRLTKRERALMRQIARESTSHTPSVPSTPDSRRTQFHRADATNHNAATSASDPLASLQVMADRVRAAHPPFKLPSTRNSDIRSPADNKPRPTKQVEPIVLLMSQGAFIDSATRWLSDPTHESIDREHLVQVQRKIFAPKR